MPTKRTEPSRPTSDYRAIGRRLREAREAANYSQEDAARFLNVTGATYSRYESGHHKVAIPEVYRLAELFGADPQYIMSGVQRRPEELPDFRVYVGLKFAKSPRLRRSLIQVYEAFREIEEELERERKGKPEETES